MYRRMIHVTRVANLRVVQPPFEVSSLIGGIGFKIFQIPELEEVIENRALRQAEATKLCDGWVPSTVKQQQSHMAQTCWGSATRLTQLASSHVHTAYSWGSQTFSSRVSLYTAQFNRSSFETKFLLSGGGKLCCVELNKAQANCFITP